MISPWEIRPPRFLERLSQCQESFQLGALLVSAVGTDHPMTRRKKGWKTMVKNLVLWLMLIGCVELFLGFLGISNLSGTKIVDSWMFRKVFGWLGDPLVMLWLPVVSRHQERDKCISSESSCGLTHLDDIWYIYIIYIYILLFPKILAYMPRIGNHQLVFPKPMGYFLVWDTGCPSCFPNSTASCSRADAESPNRSILGWKNIH